MRRVPGLVPALLLALLTGPAGAEDPATPPDPLAPWRAPGPHAVASVDLSLHDAARRKDLPLRLTFPRSGGAHPVLVFSHGALGSREGYAPLAEHLAAHGWVVVRPTHEDALALGLRGLRDAFSRWASRPVDVRLVLDRLDEVQLALPEDAGHLDAGHVAVGGHSFGAHTAMLLAGATTRDPDGGRGRHGDPRPRAFLLISPQGTGEVLDEESWDEVTRPFLVVTGTRDTSVEGRPWSWRMEPWALAPPGGKHLAVLRGAAHGFGGIAGPRRFPGSGPADPRQVDLVRALALCFLDAFALEDASARAVWADPDTAALLGGGLRLAAR